MTTTYEPYRGARPDDSAETIAAGEARDAAQRHAELTRIAAADGRQDDARFEAEAAARDAARAQAAGNQADRLAAGATTTYANDPEHARHLIGQGMRARLNANRATEAANRASVYYREAFGG